jgi:hypothetical protein
MMNHLNVDKIYVCLAEDVYAYIEEKGLEIEHNINVYFPYLFSEKQFKLEKTSFDNSIYDKYNELIDFHHKKYDDWFHKEQCLNRGQILLTHQDKFYSYFFFLLLYYPKVFVRKVFLYPYR